MCMNDLDIINEVALNLGIKVNSQNVSLLYQKLKEIFNEASDASSSKGKILIKVSIYIQELQESNLTLKQKSSLNNYLTDTKAIPEFMNILQKSTKYLAELLSENTTKISNFVTNEYIFSNKLYRKFEEIFDIFFQNKSNLTKSLKELIWIIFIYFKQVHFSRTTNILEGIGLLLSCFNSILNDINSDILPISISSNIQANPEKKSEFILENLCNNNSINYQEKHKLTDLSQFLKREIRSLGLFPNKNGEMSSLGIEVQDLTVLKENVQIVKKAYDSQIFNIKYFDETILLEDNNKDNSPVKIGSHKGVKNQMFPRPNYRRLLFSEPTTENHSVNNSFQTGIEFGSQNRSLPSFPGPHLPEPQQLKFNNFNINSLKFSNSGTKANYIDFLGMTPCSRVIEMDNWVQKYIKDVNFLVLIDVLNFSGQSLDWIKNEFNTNITKIENLLLQRKIRIKNPKEVHEKLFLKVLNELLIREKKEFKIEIVSLLINNPEFIKTVIICCSEVILFIENVEHVDVFSLISCLELDIFEFWKIINPFVCTLEIFLPFPITEHFKDIEIQILSYQIWQNSSHGFIRKFENLKNGSSLGSNSESKICNEGFENKELSKQSLFAFQNSEVVKTKFDLSSDYLNFNIISIFLRRILHYSLAFINKFCKELTLSKEVGKKIENLIKYIISERAEFIYDRYLDQIIICCIYAVAHYSSNDFKFSSITAKYKAMKTGVSDLETNFVLSKVKINSKEYKDIIQFYNLYFCKELSFIHILIDENKETKRKKIENPLNEFSLFYNDSFYNDFFEHIVYFRNLFGTPEIKAFKSASTSPDIHNSNIKTTPRAMKTKNFYADNYMNSITITENEHSTNDSNKNKLKDNIKSLLNFNKKSSISEISNSQNSQSTPEFNKHK